MPTPILILRTALLAAISFLRELAGNALSIPGRWRWRATKAADAGETAVRAADKEQENRNNER